MASSEMYPSPAAVLSPPVEVNLSLNSATRHHSLSTLNEKVMSWKFEEKKILGDSKAGLGLH